MEAKAIQATRSKLNELASSHNKLTTLVAVMLTEIQNLKEEMEAVKQMLDGVEVVSSGDSAPAPTVHQAAPARSSANRVAPVAAQAPPPPPPAAAAPSRTSSSRGGSRRNQSLADLHADDIIKQLSMNSD